MADRAKQTELIIRAWSQDASGAQRSFDDRRLLDYRHPQEARALVVAIGAVLVVLGGALVIDPMVGVFLLGGWLLAVVTTWIQVAKFMGGNVEITPNQLGHLYPIVAELRERFAMPRTRVFVIQSPEFNAFAFGLAEPYTVVVHSALVEALDELELKSVLGHEFAHIKFGHTRLGAIFGGLHVGVPFPLSVIESLRQSLSLWWQRTQEMTADRGGIIASGRPSKMVSSLVKMSVGAKLSEHVDVEQLAQQAVELRTGWNRVWGFFAQAQATHPFVVSRIQEIVGFAAATELRPQGPQTAAAQTVLADAPMLVVQQGRDTGHMHKLSRDVTICGRDFDCAIRLDDDEVSRRHFQIRQDGGRYVLEDLQSANGTYVNGTRTQRAPLQSGDVVQAGKVKLEFCVPGSLPKDSQRP